MKKTCQLAAVQVYLVLQYEFLLPLNLHQPHQKRCVSKVLRQLPAAQQAPKSQRGALAIWFLRERPKKFQKNKKKTNLVCYLRVAEVKENIQRMLARRKMAWILIKKKKKQRKKKLGYGDAGEVVNVCQWKTPTSNNTGLIKVMTHSLCPPPAQTAGQLTKGGRKKKKSFLANTDTQRTNAAVSTHKSAKGHWSIEQTLTIFLFLFFSLLPIQAVIKFKT